MTAATVTLQIRLPFDRPPKALTGNARHGHWAPRSKASRQVREAVAWRARAAGLRGPYSYLRVGLVYAPGDRRRRDADNLWPVLKAAADGLARGGRRDWAGLDLVPDDTPRWMHKDGPVIAPPGEGYEPGLYLLVQVTP